jgi:phosphate-selective porin
MNKNELGISMFRICLAAALLALGLHAASAQTAAPAAPAPAATTAKPGKIKLTMEKLKAMKTQWRANKPKLKACRAEVKAKGLTGDDRWFYIEECMTKT